ncbi:hypothetical protein UFOVP810_7 [uncultured Caudovirales phage]|uniref:Uncharacterized protein n=1 Tax=uncultured Caudovirales phage TaxID=2100421 RepID=A0A6J5P1K4_9CAUD|nr:hypothetical protein UFOVP810_7 [uncultured Caudovirales phage]
MQFGDQPAITIPYPIKLGRRYRTGVDSVSRRFPTTIRLHESDHTALNHTAELVGMSAAELVRWATMHLVSEMHYRETGKRLDMEL